MKNILDISKSNHMFLQINSIQIQPEDYYPMKKLFSIDDVSDVYVLEVFDTKFINFRQECYQSGKIGLLL